jgi:hypothetical protein
MGEDLVIKASYPSLSTRSFISVVNFFFFFFFVELGLLLVNIQVSILVQVVNLEYGP